MSTLDSEVTDGGRAVAIVSAERPETLDLLQRDAAGLRQALQDAGLSTDSNSLSFNLRGEGSKLNKSWRNADTRRSVTTKLTPTITAVTKPIRQKPRSLPPSWPLRTAGVNIQV